MYSLRNVLKQSPVTIAGAVIACVNFLLIAGVVTLTAEAVSALNMAMVAVLGLFVVSAQAAARSDDQLKGIALGQQLPTGAPPVSLS